MKLYNEGYSNPIGITNVRKRLKEFGAKRRCLRKTVIIRKENLLKRRKWPKPGCTGQSKETGSNSFTPMNG